MLFEANEGRESIRITKQNILLIYKSVSLSASLSLSVFELTTKADTDSDPEKMMRYAAMQNIFGFHQYTDLFIFYFLAQSHSTRFVIIQMCASRKEFGTEWP
jgi:hypothetical protein